MLGCICCKATATHSPGGRHRSTMLPNAPVLLPVTPGKLVSSQQRRSVVGAQHLAGEPQSLPSCDSTASPSFLPTETRHRRAVSAPSLLPLWRSGPFRWCGRRSPAPLTTSLAGRPRAAPGTAEQRESSFCCNLPSASLSSCRLGTHTRNSGFSVCLGVSFSCITEPDLSKKSLCLQV